MFWLIKDHQVFVKSKVQWSERNGLHQMKGSHTSKYRLKDVLIYYQRKLISFSQFKCVLVNYIGNI